MKRIILSLSLNCVLAGCYCQLLPGFTPSGQFDEQQMVLENIVPDTRVLINAPLHGFGDDDRVMIVFYALPNGNTIEQTFGKKKKPDDDWHYDIQHIGAQTRYLRQVIRDRTIVVVYAETRQRSWPAWKAANELYRQHILRITDEITSLFGKWNTTLVLNGHSGGGRFIFSFMDACDTLPPSIERIAFLDSSYGYEETLYQKKIVSWLQSGRHKYLCTLAYNDSVVIYNGKPLVSPEGGTWYRSKLMMRNLSPSFPMKFSERDSLLWYNSSRKRIEFILKPNPEGKIFHTTQVELNGFIHSMLSGTKHEHEGYRYFRERAYSRFISDSVIVPLRAMNIPQRAPDAETGSAFMNRIASMTAEEREKEIFDAISGGNIPAFLRNAVTIRVQCKDSEGHMHEVELGVMPDYLSVGSDDDFCRVPMTPQAAQKLAEVFGAILPTSRISDLIWENAAVRLSPFFYAPSGNSNEQVSRFEEHNKVIERQLAEAGEVHGRLVAGIKKDVIISSCLDKADDRVIIYGWHKPDGSPIQPVYCGHIARYVDYSHGVRLVNDQIILDGKKALLSGVLKDSVLFRILSDEDHPSGRVSYTTE